MIPHRSTIGAHRAKRAKAVSITPLDDIPGVVEHGLFIGYAEQVIVGEVDGARVVRRR